MKTATILQEFKPTNSLYGYSLCHVIGEILPNKKKKWSNITAVVVKPSLFYIHAIFLAQKEHHQALYKMQKEVRSKLLRESFVFLLFTNRQSKQKNSRGC
jgi:hypothetical protein